MNPATPARDEYRILIVDDSPEVRESLRWLLEDVPGLTVTGEAETGSQAVELTMSLSPDLVLLDIELPDMDGFAVTRSIKAMPRPPLVVFLSMHSDALYRQRGADAGCDAFVGKELGWSGLLATLQETLGKRP